MGGLKDLLISDIQYNREGRYVDHTEDLIERILKLKEKAQNTSGAGAAGAFKEFKYAVESLGMKMLCSKRFYERNEKGEYSSKPVRELIDQVKDAGDIDKLKEILMEMLEKIAQANIFYRETDDTHPVYVEKKKR